jgi:hypothetical protein
MLISWYLGSESRIRRSIPEVREVRRPETPKWPFWGSPKGGPNGPIPRGFGGLFLVRIQGIGVRKGPKMGSILGSFQGSPPSYFLFYARARVFTVGFWRRQRTAVRGSRGSRDPGSSGPPDPGDPGVRGPRSGPRSRVLRTPRPSPAPIPRSPRSQGDYL